MWATSKRLLLSLAILALGAHGSEATPDEISVEILPLGAPLNVRNAELSGLAWLDDNLVLLPQFPRDALWAIPKAQLYAAIEAAPRVPIAPSPIPFESGPAIKQLAGFEGFEAIAFHGTHAYLAVECETSTKMSAWLVRGIVEPDSIRLEPETLTEVPLPAQVFNMAVEAITVFENNLVVLFEANGKNLVAESKAFIYDFDLKQAPSVPLATIEYRTTDATEVDGDGRLWISNYLWPGERRILKPAQDRFAERFGVGASHRTSDTVERLIELHATESGVFQTKTPPIYLKLDPQSGRNWEGIARLDDAGFLLVTDSHPGTVLGFVPTN